MADILVIDDEESMRYTFAVFLSEAGHSVDTCETYVDAVARISQKRYDLVFSDIILEDRTGIDILREVRARDLVCPVVMVTGYPTVETAADAVRLGAFDYLPKPVEQEDLLSVTCRALDHKEKGELRDRRREQLEAVFGSVADGILTVGANLTILDMNEAATNVCGLSRSEIGRELGVSTMHCREEALAALAETFRAVKSVEIGRLERPNGVGGPHILSLSTHPLLDSRNALTGAILVMRDETRPAPAPFGRETAPRYLHNLVGGSRQMRSLYTLIGNLAPVETTVLITGESGTGKELVAEALHHMGPRSGGPLVRVNCAVLSDSLLESELFGHVKGSFTGALTDRIGRFQKADGGTVFLDEIGDISPRAQSSLLRVLQEKEFERVGDSKPIKVDVRIIAATNKDLQQKVRDGQFREDLLFRLNVVGLSLPPLRDRREDIPLLVEHFLGLHNARLNKAVRGISAAVEKIFMAYPWPGNVRELRHVLEHACVLCRQDTITTGDLPEHIATLERTAGASSQGTKPHLDGESIMQALVKTAGNKAKAARALGIDRRTLYRNIDKYGIPEKAGDPFPLVDVNEPLAVGA